MEEVNNKVPADQGTSTTPEPAAPADPAADTAIKPDKEQEIEIKQVPMDGICGGY